ncbi:MAG: lamin tail domain-containing protein, partial [Phycisphaerae bacterium]
MPPRPYVPGHLLSAAFEPLEPRLLLAGDVLISEFMADNENSFTDGYQNNPDWIELQNTTTSPIDLTGWKLVDGEDEWIFPEITIPAQGYLVVCATDSIDQDPAGYWHVGFALTTDGEYLALLDDTGTVVHQYTPAFPEQLEDISYGVLYQEHGSTVLVDKGDTAKYLISTAGPLDPAWVEPGFNDDPWAEGPTGLGFGLGAPSGSTTLIDDGSIWRYLDDGSNQGTAWQGTLFDDSGWASGAAELGYGDGGEVTVVSYGPDSGSKYITTYFRHTFNVTNAWQYSELTVRLLRDDGGVVYLNGQELVRDPNMPGGTITYTTLANSYIGGDEEFTFIELPADPTKLVEGTNVLAVEIHQSSGDSSDVSFDLELVGETSISEILGTDIEAQMRNVNATALVRMPFNVIDPLEFTELMLDMAYEDGYVAYLNGVPVAGDNAPGTLDWNSAALTDRPIEDAIRFQAVDLTPYLHLLVPGSNVLAIHALNDSATDGSFLICPKLRAAASVLLTENYFTTPTPGAPNVPGVIGMVKDTQFSVDRGFFEEEFDLYITTETSGAEIHYTVNGSEPTATTGTLYTGPVHIDKTTTLRAAAFKPGYMPTNIDTQTYVFPDDVITQSPFGQAPGAGWPTGSVNGQTIDYGMDPDIVNNTTWGPQMIDALTSIPSISMVTDLANLFNSSTGIYVHANQSGIAWERPVSVEMLYPTDASGPGFPDGADEGFQIDAGMRIRGGFSVTGSNPKHAFRLFFRQEYGDANLRYALFGREGVDEFDHVDLRTSQNYSWAFQGNSNNSFVREVFARDAQGEQGQPYTRSRYYHLYINGQYWGLYMTQERSEADFAASYFGGDADDYDVVKHRSSRTYFTDGNNAAYQRLFNAAMAGFANDTAYYRVQGMNPDGTPNPAYERLVDIDNLIDYMIGIFHSGDKDAPISNFMGNSGLNNFYGAYNRENPDGWKWFRHDGEHTLDMGMSDRTGPWTSSNFTQLSYFNPQTLHEKLCAHPDYRIRFADRVYKAFFNGGVLAPATARAAVQSRADQIDMAIIAESARWGDAKRSTPYTKSTWLSAVNNVKNFFNSRNGIVISQLRADGWYPTIDPPTFSQHGGQVSPGFQLTMGGSGAIYYTTDGTDPRLPRGGVSPDAVRYDSPVTLNETSLVKARIYTAGQWSAMHEAVFLLDEVPPLRITEIMYNPAGLSSAEMAAGFDDNDDFEYIEFKNISAEAIFVGGIRFTEGITFTFPDIYVGPGQYVVVVRNRAAFKTRYGSGTATIAGEFPTTSLSNSGEDLTLVTPLGTVIHDF